MSPFAGYEDFADCVAKNQDKQNPEAFCAWLQHQTTGKWPTEEAIQKATSPGPERCPICNASLRTPERLRVHMFHAHGRDLPRPREPGETNRLIQAC